MPNGTYKTKTGETVSVTKTTSGYLLRYADGRTTVI